MDARRPRRPTHLSDHSRACLQALAERGLGTKISLGGALGLLHYLDYRPTHDVDAWWTDSATAEDQRQVIDVIEVETHLARIAQHRRLEQITDLQRRAEAEQVRAWFRQEFLDALPSGLD